MVLGAILLGAEMFAVDAQFYLVFLGLSAIIVGVTDLVGIAMPLWAQWAVFAVLSLISMFTFRKSLYEKLRGNMPGFRESVTGDKVSINEDLEPGSETRVDLRGTRWTVRNIGSATIPGGSHARVIKTEGLVLHVSAD
jgi:membrane protein implicated in regulation of membrane protease activity